MHGDTRFRPIPNELNHVPPLIEPRSQVQFQLGF